MSVEKAKEFFVNLKKKKPDEALIERLESGMTEEERLQLYVDLAGSMGYDLTGNDLKEALSALDAEHKAKTQAAKKDLEALEDDDLEGVSGGFYYVWSNEGSRPWYQGGEDKYRVHACNWDFTDDDCYFQDACEVFQTVYYDCAHTYHERDPYWRCPELRPDQLGKKWKEY